MKRISKVDLINSEHFKKIVEENNTITSILTVIGCKNTSGIMHKKVKDRIKIEGISDGHLYKKHTGFKRPNIIPLEEILVENSTYLNRQRLKIRLVNEGVLEYKCSGETCIINGVWLGKPLSLHLDHKNGVNNDNRLENLRFLCPNCHSQTPTYSGKNNK